MVRFSRASLCDDDSDRYSTQSGAANYFDTEIWCGCTDQPKRSADVNFHYYIVRFIWHCVKHLVERESRYARILRYNRIKYNRKKMPTVIHNVIYFTVFPVQIHVVVLNQSQR